MKIGIDVRSLTKQRAGIGNYVYENIKLLNSIDKVNEFYLYSNRDINLDFKLNSNWHIKIYNHKIGTFFIYSLMPKILFNDKIDVFWGTEHCLPKRCKYTEKIKYVLTVHDLALLKIPKVGKFHNVIIQKTVLKKSCKNSNVIIAISQSTKADLLSIFGIDKEKVIVVHLGSNEFINDSVDERADKKIEKKYNLSKDGFFFFLSTIEPRKNLITAIKAFEEYKTNSNSSTKFIISGGLGWKYKNVIRAIKKSKYRDDIILTGYISREEKNYFYHNCVLFVYPSLYEGFGLPVLEAMSHGSIVITANNSSLPEVGGDAAIYYYPAQNYNNLAEKFLLVSNMLAKEKNKIKKKSISQVSKFSWSKCANNVHSILIKK